MASATRVLDVHVEYCSSCGFREHADSLEKALKEAYGASVGVTLEAGRATSFEVTTDGKATSLFSKLATKEFPEDAAIVAKVGELLKDPSRIASAHSRREDEERKADAAARSLSNPEADAVASGLIAADKVVVFAKGDWKPLKQALHDANVRYLSVDLAKRADGRPLEEALARRTGASSSPFVFVNGEYAGGLEAVVSKLASGSFAKPTGGAGVVVVEVDTAKIGPDPEEYIFKSSKKPSDVKKPSQWPIFLQWPFFWFPYNVNVVTARIVGLFVTAISILTAITAERWWSRILIAASFADFCLRVAFGARGSFLGALADAFAEFLPVKMTPGPPKQFAAMVGAGFTGGATLAAYLGAYGDDNTDGIIAARVLLAVLAACAAMEAFLDFCLGCLFYKIFEKIGIFSSDPFKKCDDILPDSRYTLEYFRRRLNEAVKPVVARFVGERALPLVYKPKSEDQRKEDFNLIRHCSINYFAMPMGIASLAAAYQTVAINNNTMTFSRGMWVGVGILAAIVFLFLLGLYFAKMIIYPKKFWKEFDCPLRVNSFAMITLTVQLFAGILAMDPQGIDRDTQFAEFLWWASGPLNMVLGIVVVARWIYRPHYRAQINPAWMMAPVGSLICGAMFPVIDSQYTQPAFLFFSYGILMWIVLLPMTLQGLTFGNLPSNLRFTVCIYVAAPAAALLCYQNITGTGNDTFGTFLFYFTLAMFLLVSVLGFNNYFFRHRWSMDYWFAAFPANALSIVCTMYYLFQGPESNWSRWMMYMALAITTFIHLILGANTIAGLFGRYGIFVPEKFPLPQQWAMMTHFAMRPALKKMVELAANLGNADSAKQFAELFYNYKTLYESHACYEDGILFPSLEEWFPGVTEPVQQDHMKDSVAVQELAALIAQLVPSVTPSSANSSFLSIEYKLHLHSHHSVASPAEDREVDAARLADRVQAAVTAMAEHHNKHFDLEEQHLAPVVRKYFGIQRAKELSRKMFLSVPIPAWRKILPFVVNNMDIHQRRVQFLTLLSTSMPERAQLVGQMVYEGVDKVMWDRVAADVPAIIPRGLPGHWHLY